MANKNLQEEFVAEVVSKFGELSGEINERNDEINEKDQYIYGNLLERSLDIPFGHDFTPVNWLRRTVEIHKNMFMSRGFKVSSTYNVDNIGNAINDEEKDKLKIDNSRQKDIAEQRIEAVNAIIEDNGGNSLWDALAENASAVGDAAIKAYYDEKQEKYVLSQIESIENLYVLWNNNDFRSYDAVAYVWQVSKQEAVRTYGASEDVQTSVLGAPMEYITSTTPTTEYANTQPMVSVFEVTGKIEGWATEKGKLKRVKVGKETEMNAIIVGNEVKKIRDDEKRIPRYYLFPNKRQRNRAWGVSDVSDAAVNINATYVETLSDWRTHAAKVNFQKYKAYGFGPDSQIPKSKNRKTQVIPLAEGQDLQRLDQGDSNADDFMRQMEELKEQFVRETGVSRVLFDDPSVTLNSNQALLTSMKPTSDIAEAKKQLWTPVIIKMFSDALETLAMWDKELEDLVDGSWGLKVMWPSIMQKEDPVYQQMLLNRFNAGTMSVQTFLENQGESKEELDRLRDELEDPVTAAIIGRNLGLLTQNVIAPPQPDAPAQPKVNVSLRGDLTPQQEANLASQSGFNDGPFPPSMGPQGTQGNIAYQNADNQGFLSGEFPNQQPITRGPDGQPVGRQKQDTNTGQDANQQISTQANNQEGTGAVSQPGSGAPATSAQGAINQTNQNNGA